MQRNRDSQRIERGVVTIRDEPLIGLGSEAKISRWHIAALCETFLSDGAGYTRGALVHRACRLRAASNRWLCASGRVDVPSFGWLMRTYHRAD